MYAKAKSEPKLFWFRFYEYFHRCISYINVNLSDRNDWIYFAIKYSKLSPHKQNNIKFI